MESASVRQAFPAPPPSLGREQTRRAQSGARALETPDDLRRGLFGSRTPSSAQPIEPAVAGSPGEGAPSPRRQATETIAQRAGALLDEIDFASFVAGLVHGTFDAIVDASIRQMETFADLVSAVAKDVNSFTSENVSLNQARDALVERHRADIEFVPGAPEPRLRVRARPGDDDEARTPDWLSDYGLAGEELTDELVEEQLVPAARRRLGESRLQMLATMVLLGMNRVVVRDGTIAAKLRFRAAAQDKATVEYAVSQDPGADTWGTRGSGVYAGHSTMISTVGVNAQTDASLKAELFGEVKINFASETLPLERFADEARMTLLQRHARASSWQARPGGAAAAPAPSPAETQPTLEPRPAATPAPPPPAKA